MLVALIGLGALALAACAEPLKPAPEPEAGPALPAIQICAPVRAAPAEASVQTEDPCVPFCLPGQEPPAAPAPALLPEPPAAPECVPICDPFAPPEMRAELAQRCVNIPIPCLPGQEDPREEFAQALQRCVNFCLPGEEPEPPQAFRDLERGMCVQLCELARVIRGLPGLEPCPGPPAEK